METTLGADVESDPQLLSAVKAADDVLRKSVGRSQQPLRGHWRLVSSEAGKALVELELSDQGDSVARQFATEELGDHRELRSKLFALWGDLIMLAFRNSQERMLVALRELRKEEESREAQLQGA